MIKEVIWIMFKAGQIKKKQLDRIFLWALAQTSNVLLAKDLA